MRVHKIVSVSVFQGPFTLVQCISHIHTFYYYPYSDTGSALVAMQTLLSPTVWSPVPERVAPLCCAFQCGVTFGQVSSNAGPEVTLVKNHWFRQCLRLFQFKGELWVSFFP